MNLTSRFPLKSALVAVLAVSLLAGCGKNKGKVSFANLTDGAEVESPFTVRMQADNLTVEPASEGVKDGHGHFHILVDTPVPMSLDPIPNDAQHIHYGLGQTEAVLDLPEGEHTLILQFAKGDHRPYDPQITQEIRVRVTKRNAPAGGDGMDGANGAASVDGATSHDGTHGASGAQGTGSGANGGSRGTSDTVRTGDPRNIQAAPGAGMGTGSGSSGSSGSSGGGAM